MAASEVAMVLSDRTIKEEIARGRIIIDPVSMSG